MSDLENAVKQIPSNATMRDIFDFCQKWKLENLAQGMIELSVRIRWKNKQIILIYLKFIKK